MIVVIENVCEFCAARGIERPAAVHEPEVGYLCEGHAVAMRESEIAAERAATQEKENA